MNVTVLFFAAHREAMQRNRLEVDLDEGATVNELFHRLEELEPAMTKLRRYTSFAVNREVTSPESRLRDGDEVALLQPVSGGSDD